MSDEQDPTGPEPAESARAARDADLAESLAIDDIASRHDAAADDLPAAESPAPRPPRPATMPEADLRRLEAAHRGEDPAAPRTGRNPAEGALGTDPAAASADPSESVAAADPAEPAELADGSWRERRRAKKARAAQKPKRKAPWWELPALVVLAIGIAILLKTFVIQPFYIPSASMEKTLYGSTHGGDRILVNKPIYDLRDPHPGDIVVFNAPPGWNDEPATQPPSNPVLRLVRGFGQLVGFVPPDGLVLVKRVIATGGQTVLGEQGAVYVCSQSCALPADWTTALPPPSGFRKLDEPYVFEDGQDQAATFGPVTVPKGRLWVMGDHRNDSADSRYHCSANSEDLANIGATCNPTSSTVPVSDVIGKAVVIAWPPSRWRTLGTPSTFSHDAASAAGALSGQLPIIGAVALVVPLALARRRRRRSGRG